MLSCNCSFPRFLTASFLNSVQGILFCSREETTRVQNCLQPHNGWKSDLKEQTCFHATAVSQDFLTASLLNSVQGIVLQESLLSGDDCPFDKIEVFFSLFRHTILIKASLDMFAESYQITPQYNFMFFKKHFHPLLLKSI